MRMRMGWQQWQEAGRRKGKEGTTTMPERDNEWGPGSPMHHPPPWQHLQLPLWATAHRVETGSGWDGDGRENEENWGGKGPRDVVDIFWAIGMFFSFLFHFLLTNRLFRYWFRLLVTMMKRMRDGWTTIRIRRQWEDPMMITGRIGTMTTDHHH